MIEPHLSCAKAGFRLVIYDRPRWANVAEKVYDRTLGHLCCTRFTPWRVSSLLHKTFIESLPEGPKVEEHDLTVEEAWVAAKALDLNMEMSWALTVSIMAEEEYLAHNFDRCYYLRSLLDRHGFDQEGYAKEDADAATA